jgi:glycerate 2-kinase
MNTLGEQALRIWHSAVAAVRPHELLANFIQNDSTFQEVIRSAKRLLVVGAGKAGAAMAEALESALSEHLDKVTGLVNVPADAVRPLQKIRLHAARPPATNFPTAEGVTGAEEMLALLRSANPDDVALCLISGGGSALLPAPDGVSLAEKQAITKLLHGCGATILEMNTVRKHLSRVKGGRMAQAFTGRTMFSLIISDVVGDPLDVIASGPTAADESTFADALAVLERYGLTQQVPAVVAHLQRGAKGEIPETLKEFPAHVHNIILANNSTSLQAATRTAEALGFRILNLGSFIEGETQPVAIAMVGIAQSVRQNHLPIAPPACVLLGGETTVTLGANPGKGGRNQEFVLAALHKLGLQGMKNVVVLSGGTDGEDGPTDAAGAIAGEWSFVALQQSGLSIEATLKRHDAYPLFDAIGGLIRTGLTNTNVMDVRVILVG